MKLRWYHMAILALAALLLIAAMALIGNSRTDRDMLYQVSALDLLSNGSYDGIMTVGDLKQHGDFGLGAFDRLNGEMVELNGTIYRVTSDGVVSVANDSATLPFAEVTYFDADTTIDIPGSNNFSTLEARLDEKLPSKIEFYAIRIHETFPYLKIRAPPAQKKPYPPLADALKNQSVFELYNVTGTIVGFYSPAYAKGIGSPGYHFHFISDDRLHGGHVLDFEAGATDVQLDDTPRFTMALAA